MHRSGPHHGSGNGGEGGTRRRGADGAGTHLHARRHEHVDGDIVRGRQTARGGGVVRRGRRHAAHAALFVRLVVADAVSGVGAADGDGGVGEDGEGGAVEVGVEEGHRGVIVTEAVRRRAASRSSVRRLFFFEYRFRCVCGVLNGRFSLGLRSGGSRGCLFTLPCILQVSCCAASRQQSWDRVSITLTLDLTWHLEHKTPLDTQKFSQSDRSSWHGS